MTSRKASEKSSVTAGSAPRRARSTSRGNGGERQVTTKVPARSSPAKNQTVTDSQTNGNQTNNVPRARTRSTTRASASRAPTVAKVQAAGPSLGAKKKADAKVGKAKNTPVISTEKKPPLKVSGPKPASAAVKADDPSKLGKSKPDLITKKSPSSAAMAPQAERASDRGYGTYRKEGNAEILEVPSARPRKVIDGPPGAARQTQRAKDRLKDELITSSDIEPLQPAYDVSRRFEGPPGEGGEAEELVDEDFEEYDLSDLEEDFSEYDVEESVAAGGSSDQGEGGHEEEENLLQLYKASAESSRVGDIELEQNLGSSGFESLQEDLYYPLADKLSKSLSSVSEIKSVANSTDLRPQLQRFDKSRVKRARDLMELVRLNSVTYTVYDKPSIKYEIFVKLFGRKNAKQAETQTHERAEAESQTESGPSVDKAVQQPHFSGEPMEMDSSNCSRIVYCDPFKLSAFLAKAEKLIELINDTKVEPSVASPNERRNSNTISTKSARRTMKTPPGSEGFVSSCHKLMCSPLAKNAPISLLQRDSQYLLSVQTIQKKSIEKSLLALWPLEAASNPSHLLIARSLATCCSTDEKGRVFAGMSDGSLALWDLTEQSHIHRQILINGQACTLRSPSFSTACLCPNDSHKASVVSIHTFRGPNDEEDEGAGSQLISVDETGLVAIWEVHKTYQAEMSYSSKSGEGMSPGSSIKLLKKSTISGAQSSHTNYRIVCTAAPPGLSGSIYLGTNYGQVLRTSRFGDSSMLAAEHRNPILDERSASVTGIAFNPVNGLDFLVAYEDGSLCLFAVQESEPQQIWDPNDTLINEIVAVEWLATKASSFALLDVTSSIFLWDLAASIAPIFTLSLARITNMRIFSNSQYATIALGAEDGNIEVLTLNDRFGADARNFRLGKLLSLFAKPEEDK